MSTSAMMVDAIEDVGVNGVCCESDMCVSVRERGFAELHRDNAELTTSEVGDGSGGWKPRLRVCRLRRE